MKKFFPVSILAIFIFLTACNQQKTYKTQNPEFSYKGFPNILNIQNVPDSVTHRTLSSASDLGAWFNFALPAEDTKEFYGAFTGPYVLGHSLWVSKALTMLTVTDVANNTVLDLSAAKKHEFIYYPGLLQQTLELDNLTILLELTYATDKSAVIRTTIKNTSENAQEIQLGWKGSMLTKLDEFYAKENQLFAVRDKNDLTAVVTFPVATVVEIMADASYLATSASAVTIDPGKEISTQLVTSIFFKEEYFNGEAANINSALANPSEVFDRNEKRWDGYINNILVESSWLDKKEYQDLAVKCLLTLVNNWRTEMLDLKFDGLFPSYHASYFNGFWAWDSWKHAVALAGFAPELAKDQIRVMYDYQNDEGMIADCIYTNKDWTNWRDTKPPLSAWAIWAVYEASNDKAFLEEMYEKVLKYHDWWFRYRDHDQNGLCEYGATIHPLNVVKERNGEMRDGRIVAAGWESGMDNAVRFVDVDLGIEILENKENDKTISYSVNQESVDLNAYLYAEKKYIASMAEVLGKTEKAKAMNEEAEAFKKRIQTRMFDTESGYFYDVLLGEDEFRKVQGPEGWIPLWANAATKEQAEKVKQIIMDTTKFSTHVPFPTLAVDHPRVDTSWYGYWRGPVWLDQAYFGVKALDNYGFDEEAKKMRYKIFHNAEGLLNTDQAIRENYSPLSGRGLKAKHFSWSAAHILLLLQEK